MLETAPDQPNNKAHRPVPTYPTYLREILGCEVRPGDGRSVRSTRARSTGGGWRSGSKFCAAGVELALCLTLRTIAAEPENQTKFALPASSWLFVSRCGVSVGKLYLAFLLSRRFNLELEYPA